MKKNGQVNISFGWLFAIILGAFILFLAIFISRGIIDSGSKINNVELARKIENSFGQLEMGVESGGKVNMEFSRDTKMSFSCEDYGIFGRQRLGVSQKISGKYTQAGTKISFENRYVFAENPIEGKKFYIFTKPFNYPFKVADLIIIVPVNKNYCFENAPEEIESDLSIIPNMNFSGCSEGDEKICFRNGRDCDINVDYSLGRGAVKKEGKSVYFDKGLIYGAIFGDIEEYDCQVKRLMSRAQMLIELYEGKSRIISNSGCEVGVINDLISLKSMISSVDGSAPLDSISVLVNDIESKNKIAPCEVF